MPERVLVDQTDLASKQSKLSTTTIKTAAYTASANELVVADASAGTVPITLPSAATVGAGAMVVATKIDTSANLVTVQKAGTDTINVALTSVSLALTDESLSFISDGTSRWTAASGQKSLAALDLRFTKRREIVNDLVKDFGADPTGVVDASTALQNCIDASMTTADPVNNVRMALRPMRIPQGYFKVTTPPIIKSVQGFRLIGDGANSVLQLSGNLSAGLILQGVAYSEFADFDIRGLTVTDTVTSAIALDWDVTQAKRSSSVNHFQGIAVRDLKYVNAFAFGLNSAGFQVDQVTVEKCGAYGKWVSGETTWWQNGFVSGSGTHGNPLNHDYSGCLANGNRYNLWANACNAYWWGGCMGFAEADIRHTGARPISVGGFRSETSKRLLLQTGGSSYLSAVSLRDIYWSTDSMHTDGRFISMGYAGELTMDNIVLTEYESPGSNPSLYYLSSQSRPLNVTARNTRSRTAIASFFTTSGTAAPMNVSVDGYTEVDVNGAPVAVYTTWTKKLGTFSNNQLPTFSDGIVLGTTTVSPTDLAKPPDIQDITATGTWTKPTGAKVIQGVLVGDGGGSGSGRKGADGTIRCGGGSGGAGSVTRFTFDASDIASTVTVTIGPGGVGGPSVTTNSTNGNNGTAGTGTSFGSYARASGGGAGLGGTSTSGSGGAGVFGGPGTTGAGVNASTSGGAGIGANPGVQSAGAGAAGGGITAANVPGNGASGGINQFAQTTAGTGGIVDGTLPTSGTIAAAKGAPGPGAGSGAASVTTNAQTGANAIGYGGSGGGGGAAKDDVGNSGAGGNGAPGRALIITYF